MRTGHILIASAVAAGLLIGLTARLGAEVQIDNRIYAELLGRYVNDGRVDYKGFKSDEARLDEYLKVLSQVKPKDLAHDERFAFYINAYNAWTIKLILSGYPGIQSIKDLGSFFASPWKKKIAAIDGQTLSLDQIEHDILRPQFKDPRVHFAINCAARSCPPLISEPYRGAELNRQLDANARNFINDPKNNYLEGDTLWASMIFKWFAEDFGQDIIGFFLKFAQGPLQAGLDAKNRSIQVKYLDYDWSLNDT
jgi:hypothetical protein